MSVVGNGLDQGVLSPAALEAVVRDGVDRLPLGGKRVLLIIPDGTRTMPVPAVFDLLERHLAPRTSALDVLIALGTHSPMTDAHLTRHLGRPVVKGLAGRHRVYNHRWDDPSTFLDLGVIPAAEIAGLTGGRLEQDVHVALNRLVVEYDHVLICGPVFPHEVVGFSGGTKYLFPGIAAPPIIHFTHWLGALITSYEVIGTMDTPVRAVIDRAASLLATPVSLLALVVVHEGVAGAFCGETKAAWRHAAELSSRRHVVWVDRPYDRVLSVMPEMYEDLWTAAKGAYKTEPVVADGGEIIIYAPHVRAVSHVHGRLIEEIGYHCRDYFLAQWDRFGGYPGGILAHSTHVKGQGTYDPVRGDETPRSRVTLGTGIDRATCERINLGYRDPADIDPAAWLDEGRDDTLVVPRAGEMLYRLKK